MPDLESVKSRLNNIRIVEPILGALRTISLASYQAALKKRGGLRRYAGRLEELLPILAPHLRAPGTKDRNRYAVGSVGGYAVGGVGETPTPEKDGEGDSERFVLVVVGTERGLVGRFNEAVVGRTALYLEEREGDVVELGALGSRLERVLEREGFPVKWTRPLSVTALPSFELAFGLTTEWLSAFEDGELDGVLLAYNGYLGVGRYEPVITRLIPPEPPTRKRSRDGGYHPPTIVETDPLSLYARIVEQWTALRFFSLLLESAAAENSTRYQLMEGASQNAERLIDELTEELQSIRRQTITREMQDLAVGAGLLGR